MIEIQPKTDLIELHISGTLTSEDYERLLPRMEQLAEERGALPLYIELEDFQGWKPEALWKDVKFDATHQDDMKRVAVVGEKKLEEWGTKVSKPFFKADMRFFSPDEADEARDWLRAD